MTELAGAMALAAFLAMSIAALRLLTHTHELHGRSCVRLTGAFWLYLLFHGVAAVLPFPVYHFWQNDWPSLITVSPWLLAVITPLVVNRMLKLQGVDFPEASGPLSSFRDQVRRDFEQRMIDAEFAAMREFLAPYADGRNLFEVRAVALQNLPLQLPPDRAEAFRTSLRDAKTLEDAMELYIRHIGRKSFKRVFGKRREVEAPAPALLPLFDQLDVRLQVHLPTSDRVVREIA